MIRVLVSMSNGYCGCDEEFLMSFAEGTSENEIWEFCLEAYSYTEGFAGSENFEEEAEEAGFESLDEFWEEQINEYSGFEIIDEEEYIRLKEEEDMEER